MSNKSVTAFLEQIRTGKAKSKASEIYNFFSHPKRIGGCDLNWFKTTFHKMPHQTLTARLSELCDMGLIWEDNNGYFHITEESQIEAKSKAREIERYDRWLKVGEKNGWLSPNVGRINIPFCSEEKEEKTI